MEPLWFEQDNFYRDPDPLDPWLLAGLCAVVNIAFVAAIALMR